MTMEDAVTVLRTESGNDIKVPVESSRSAATATAEAGVFGESDPQFTTLTLRAHKFGALVQVSAELLNESGIDLVGYLSDQFAVAIGTAVNYVADPRDRHGRACRDRPGFGPGKTGGTAVAGAFTFERPDRPRSRGRLGVRPSSEGRVDAEPCVARQRPFKLQDGGGKFIYDPVNATGPDQLLGFPVFENPDMAAIGASREVRPVR